MIRVQGPCLDGIKVMDAVIAECDSELDLMGGDKL